MILKDIISSDFLSVEEVDIRKNKRRANQMETKDTESIN